MYSGHISPAVFGSKRNRNLGEVSVGHLRDRTRSRVDSGSLGEELQNSGRLFPPPFMAPESLDAFSSVGELVMGTRDPGWIGDVVGGIRRGAITVMGGGPGMGKTAWAMACAEAVVAGGPFFGTNLDRPSRPCVSLYADFEDRKETLRSVKGMKSLDEIQRGAFHGAKETTLPESSEHQALTLT